MSDIEKRIEYLSEFVLPERLNKMCSIIANRTRYVTIVVEDVYQSHNSNAVVRSAECFGVQDVHVVQDRNNFEINDEISMGSAQWLNIYRHQDIESCIDNLKQKGYIIAATMPAEKDMIIQKIPLDKPIAFLFGTERNGLSPEAIKKADIKVKIPMYGFTESFNVSVSSALVLMNYTERLRNSEINWKLTSEEEKELLLAYLRTSIREVKKIEKRYNENLKNEK